MSVNKRHLTEVTARAKELALEHGSKPTEAQKLELKSLMDQIDVIKADVDREESFAKQVVTTTHGSKNDVYAQIKAAGHNVWTNPRVELASVGAKALMSDGTDANIASIELANDGRDERFAYKAFPTLGLGIATSVQGLVQTARTLADPADMDVPIAGTSAKPESVVSVALTTWDAVMIAHLTEAIPVKLWEQPSIGQFVRDELGYGLSLGIDDYLVNALTGASGTNTFDQGTAGTTTLDSYRSAIRVARASGHTPDVLLVHPNDAYALDVARDYNEAYYGAGPTDIGFPRIWGVKVVESNAVTEHYPVLVDTRRFGKVYFGATSFATNAFSDGTLDMFGTNTAKGRLETPMLVAVQDATAIVEITLS